MKIQIIVLFLLFLMGTGSAETYQLGSHNVSLNLSIPANYTIETPMYQSKIDAWWYVLSITPDTGGKITVAIEENSIPMRSSYVIQEWAASHYKTMKERGVGGYKYGMTTYQGHDAVEDYYPAQKLFQGGRVVESLPETHSIFYLIDDLTVVIVNADNTDESIYRDVLDSMNITKNDTKSSQLEIKGTKSFIGPTSAYAGTGKGAKLGMEDQNIVTMLGDSQSSNITVGPHGVK